jgi:hypothetical protein
MKSPYYQKLALIAKELDNFYQEILENDVATNIKKYFDIIKTFLRTKLSEMDEIGKKDAEML